MNCSCPCRQLYEKQNSINVTKLNTQQLLNRLEKNILCAIYLNEILFDGVNEEKLSPSENVNENWIKFWAKNGNDLILRSWILKYKDYIDPNYTSESLPATGVFAAAAAAAAPPAVDEDGVSSSEENSEKYERVSLEETQCFCGLIDLDNILIIFDRQTSEEQFIIDNISENLSKLKTCEDDWNTLWEKHYENQYKLHYRIFLEIYSSYTSIRNIDVRTRQTTCIGSYSYLNDSQFDEDSPSDVDYILIEEDNKSQLRALGLPTSFGKHRRKKSVQNFNELFGDNFETKAQNISSIDEELLNYISVIELYTDEHNDDTDGDESIIQSSKQNDGNSMLGTNSTSEIECNGTAKEVTPPLEILHDKTLYKYWNKRFSLFSRFDDGIKLDRESWFSVTPEKVAQHIAKRLKCSIIVDAFCGSGGNSIQFAFYCDRVIAIDIDPKKIEMAKNNAKIYGVEKKIDFIIGDFLNIYHCLRADILFLSPPWGGPQYSRYEKYDIEKNLLPLPATKLLEISRTITPNISLYLPRNTDIPKLIKTAGEGNQVEIEFNFLNKKEVALSAYYGNLSKKKLTKVNHKNNRKISYPINFYKYKRNSLRKFKIDKKKKI